MYSNCYVLYRMKNLKGTEIFLFQEQQKAAGPCEGLRQALQHGPGGSQRDVDRAAQERER